MGGNGVKRRGPVGVITVRGALSVLPKSPPPLKVTRFNWVAYRVGVETLMETCSTRWTLYAVEFLVNLVGVSALSWMSLALVPLNSLSRLV